MILQKSRLNFIPFFFFGFLNVSGSFGTACSTENFYAFSFQLWYFVSMNVSILSPSSSSFPGDLIFNVSVYVVGEKLSREGN